jgi:hypothetical protein
MLNFALTIVMVKEVSKKGWYIKRKRSNSSLKARACPGNTHSQLFLPGKKNDAKTRKYIKTKYCVASVLKL